MMVVREACENDLNGLLELYTELNDNPMPDINDELNTLWKSICSDKNHHIVIAEVDGKIASSCVCVIIPNLTHNQQPYALIENVITSERYRCRGLATACLDYSAEIARREGCYKIMLMTGSKKESTLNFYKRAGYNKDDKTAFIQWI